MRASDVVPAVVLLALSATAGLGSWPLGYWSDVTPGPAFLPVWAAAAGVLLSVLRLAEARRLETAAIECPDRGALIRVGLALAGLVAFAGLSPVLGMVTAAALFMAFLLIVVQHRPLGPSLVTTAITAGLIYVVFVRWLGVRLPTGVAGL